MKKAVDNLKKITLGSWDEGFLFILVTVLVLFAGTFFLFNIQSKDILYEQMLHREQLSSRANAKALETFIDLFGRSLVTLSHQDGVKYPTPDTKNLIDEYYSNWLSTPVWGIVMTDNKGYVKFNSNKDNKPDLNAYLGDREYFNLSKSAKTGTFDVSNPVVSKLGPSKDKHIVLVYTPIISDDGRFVGLLAASVVFEDLSKQYFGPHKLTDRSFEYLVDEKGNVLASDQPGIPGRNMFDELNKNPFLGSKVLGEQLQEALISKKEGKIKVAYPADSGFPILSKMLVAYSPVKFGSINLMQAIAVPESDALVFLTPIYVRVSIIVAVTFLIIVIVGIRISKIRGYREAVEDEHKLHKLKNNNY